MSGEGADGGGFNPQKIVEEREKESVSSNPRLIAEYVISMLFFSVAVLEFTPDFGPQMGSVTFGFLLVGAIAGFGFMNDRSLSLPKRLASTVCYLVFAFLGMIFFSSFFPMSLKASIPAIVFGLSAVAGGSIWYYLRSNVLSTLRKTGFSR